MRITTRQFAVETKNFNKLHEFSFQTDNKVALSSVIRAINSNKQNLFSSMNCFVSFSPHPTPISLTTLIETIMICDKTFSLESFEIFKSTAETRVYTREPNKLNVQWSVIGFFIPNVGLNFFLGWRLMPRMIRLSFLVPLNIVWPPTFCRFSDFLPPLDELFNNSSYRGAD